MNPLKQTYCECCDTGCKRNCCCGLKRTNRQVRSFFKLPNHEESCDAIYDLDANNGYFVEFKSIYKFVNKEKKLTSIMSDIQKQLSNTVERYEVKFSKNNYFLAYDKNPLPDKANRTIYNNKALKRLEYFQIIPRAKDFGIIANDCETIFYLLQSHGLNI